MSLSFVSRNRHEYKSLKPKCQGLEGITATWSLELGHNRLKKHQLQNGLKNRHALVNVGIRDN